MSDAPSEHASTPPPSAAFLDTAARAAVRDEDRDALWTMLRSGPNPGGPARLAQLEEDYGHWLLYRQSRLGDAEAAAAFERYWTAHARAFLSRRCPAHAVDEITARFFERLYRLVGERFAWPCPFAVYLRTMLLNLSRDYLAEAARSRTVEQSLDRQPSTAAGVADRGLSPEQRLLQRELGEGLRAALSELPEQDRQIVLACLVDGKAGQDVAAELGMTRDALYQRLHRARKRLQRALRAGGYP